MEASSTVPSSKSNSLTSQSALVPSPAPVLRPAPLAATSGTDPVHRHDLALAPVLPHIEGGTPILQRGSPSAAGHMAGEALLAETRTVPVVRAVLLVPSPLFVEVRSGWHPGDDLPATNVEAMDLTAPVDQNQGVIQYALVAHAAGPSRVRGHAPCPIHPIRGTVEAKVGPGQSAGEGKVIVVMILGTVGRGHQKVHSYSMYFKSSPPISMSKNKYIKSATTRVSTKSN